MKWKEVKFVFSFACIFTLFLEYDMPNVFIVTSPPASFENLTITSCFKLFDKLIHSKV